MKYLLVLCVVIAAVLAEEKYTDKYDNINLKDILENKRLLTSYIDCVMGRGKCTTEGSTLKENIQEAIESGCKKCTEIQENKATEVFNHLIKQEPAIWNELTEKFDPKGIWRKKYEAKAQKLGIN